MPGAVDARGFALTLKEGTEREDKICVPLMITVISRCTDESRVDDRTCVMTIGAL